MDEDRIVGAVRRAKGIVKKVAGRLLGDAKLEADGKKDQVAGTIQNAVGGVKDSLKT